MNVLIVTFEYFPDTGGVGVAAENTASIFEKLGCKVEIATYESKIRRSAYFRNGIRVNVFDHSKSDSGWHDFSQILENFEPDLILLEAHGPDYNRFVSKIRNVCNARVILRSHGYFYHLNEHTKFSSLSGWLRNCARRFLNLLDLISVLRTIDGLIALSVDKSFRSGIDFRFYGLLGKGRPFVIPNFVPEVAGASKDSTLLEKHSLSGRILLLLANYSAIKNQIAAIDAFIETKSDVFSLVMIGSGDFEYFTKVKQRIGAYTGDKKMLALYGESREDVQEVISAADVMILSSLHEMQPITLIEGMSRAKPWICTDCGAVKYFKGGIAVRKNDNFIHNLASAIDTLAWDDALYSRLAEEGRLYWEKNHSESAVSQRWVEVLTYFGNDQN